MSRFTGSAMLVMAGMGCGMVAAYWGGLLLWGGLLFVLVVAILAREWGQA